MTEVKKWWGEFTFTLEQTRCWRVGKRVIAIKRNEHEWTVWNKTTDDEEDKPISVGGVLKKDGLDDADYQRFMLRTTSDVLRIEPSLADRAMIARPSKPIVIMPQEEITLYVSTPLWMTILLPNRDVPMTEIPFWRPSDTWFGPNSMHGDLCYSKYTDAKMNKQVLEKRSHRATTMVTLKNDQAQPLSMQRLNLPVPALKIYVDASGEFWTDQVNILQRTELSKSVSHMRHSPPEGNPNMQQISESRELSKKPSFLSSIRNLVE